MRTLQNNRILIVDDDASIRGLMAKHFSRRGFEVEQAEAAEDVIERFGSSMPRFDVVVTDVHLPGQSGVDLARRIKEVEPGQAVVFMTGDPDAAIARQALQNGAESFLLKPFEFSEIDTAVRNAVQRKSAHVTVAARVVLAPVRRRRRRSTRRTVHTKIAATIAAVLSVGFMAGVGLAPAPVNTPAVAAGASGPASDSRPMVIPIVIERSIYLK